MSRLWNKTKELLETTDKTMAEICVGTGLTYAWLQTVKYGKGRRGGPVVPSVEKAERLYEFLSGKKLDV
nr:hypothetical protein ART_00099 [Achromobacter phage vB_Ade_ART]